MPFLTTTLVRFTAKLSRCLSLALLPALASEARAIVGQPQRKQNLRPASAQISESSPAARKAGAVPYLAALGPLPLRFARPGPEPTDEPPAPPEPKVIALIVTPEADKPKSPAEPPPTTPASEIKVSQPEHAPEQVSEFEEPNAQPALRILPDDTRREIRPEDVLPFFLYPTAPASSGEPRVQVAVPLPASQSQSPQPSASSATYQQQ